MSEERYTLSVTGTTSYTLPPRPPLPVHPLLPDHDPGDESDYDYLDPIKRWRFRMVDSVTVWCDPRPDLPTPADHDPGDEQRRRPASPMSMAEWLEATT